MCLTSASRAFKFTLKKFGGKVPTYDEEFCSAMTAYGSFLNSFGETVEAANLDRTYGGLCEQKPGDASCPPTQSGGSK